MTETSKGYRRVKAPADEATPPPAAPTPRKRTQARRTREVLLRVALATLGAILLVASGAQLLELMAASPSSETARGALGQLPTTQIPWTTVAGAVLMPVTAVLCFVAFGALRTRVLRT